MELDDPLPPPPSRMTEKQPIRERYDPDTLDLKMPVAVISRDEWGAIPSRGELPPLTTPLEKVHITIDTHSRSCMTKDQCISILKYIQDVNINNDGEQDIKYNFLIGSDGNVYEGRGWKYKPALASQNPEYSDKTLDIAYIGKYDDSRQSTRRMFARACDLVISGAKNNYLYFGEFKFVYEDDNTSSTETMPDTETKLDTETKPE